MKTVYVCSPFRPVGADPKKELRENIEVAKELANLLPCRGIRWNVRICCSLNSWMMKIFIKGI